MHRKRWLWLAVACGVAFFILTLPLLWGRSWPGEWAVVQEALRLRSPAWTPAMQAVTFFGSSAVGLGLSSGMTALLLLHERHLSRRVWLPLAAMLGSAPINFGLRVACGRLRPGVSYIPHRLPELTHPFQRWSYPSGHAMTVTICYGVLVYFLVSAYPRTGRVALPLLALWFVTVGFSRIYLGVHWPTDVLGGYLAGGFWLALCIAFLA